MSKFLFKSKHFSPVTEQRNWYQAEGLSYLWDMNIVDLPESNGGCHLVAVPFPGRGHINPMMNLCKLLASRKQDILITFVVTEEWLGYIRPEPKPNVLRFVTIPNVIPSEKLKAVDFPRFYESVMTKMETPFQQLLDRIEPPVTAIIGDIELRWSIDVGNRRNIPVAALWTMSASFLSMLYHFDIFRKNQNLTTDLLENVDEIPGISSSNVSDLRTLLHRNDLRVLQLALECVSKVPKAQYLLFTCVYELEARVFDTLRATFKIPVYPVGPAIPYLELQNNFSNNICIDNDPSYSYLQWLDSQPKDSVLYISLGSFLSVSNTQMDEIVAGLRDSGVRYLWVARNEATRLKDICNEMGLVLPWCDQLKVLCHSSVGGFWTHCGWNSILEAVFAGVPMLTFPLFLDQDPNMELIVEDWRIGWRVERNVDGDILVSRGQIAEVVRRLMDWGSSEGRDIRKRARELGDICRRATAEGGSTTTNLDTFMRDILQGNSS